MHSGKLYRATWRYFGLVAALLSTVMNLATPGLAADVQKHPATTPIQHVIVIIGENRTFDHVFATYQAPAGQKVDNLLSKGIIKANGTPGPNFKLAAQFKASDTVRYEVSPVHTGPWKNLPPTNTQGTPTSPSDAHPAPFQTIAAAEQAEPGLLASDYVKLTRGASGLPQGGVAPRVANVFH